MISRVIGLLYPESCLASHINMIRSDGVSSTPEKRAGTLADVNLEAAEMDSESITCLAARAQTI